ncbi:endonuclease domain-containing protein [Sphingobium abikonense]|uniref:endonuclease domain-containing protein n=1 Tax=Sphingobium abikonense TaxID=86193 RepID=UPI003517C34C
MTDETHLPPPASGRGPARPFKQRDTTRAKALRNSATIAEQLLWQCLKGKKLGYKFSRQMPVGPYFADFLCRELRLIIEIDGASHDQTIRHDERRDHYCRSFGFKILRISHDDVMTNLDGVVLHIQATLAQAHPQPLPPAGGE